MLQAAQLIIVWVSTVNNGRTGRAAGGQAACTVDSSSSFLQDGAASPALFIKSKGSKVGRSTISLFFRSRLQDQDQNILLEGFVCGISTVKVCGKRSPGRRSRKHTAVKIDLPVLLWRCPGTPENGFYRGSGTLVIDCKQPIFVKRKRDKCGGRIEESWLYLETGKCSQISVFGRRSQKSNFLEVALKYIVIEAWLGCEVCLHNGNSYSR